AIADGLTLDTQLWVEIQSMKLNPRRPMKKLLLLMLFVSPFAFMACDDGDPSPAQGDPIVIAPSTTTDVEVETAADITFTVTAPGGYKSSTVAPTGGTATKKSEPPAGATPGNIVITYTADANAGAGSVTVTVTDNANKASSQVAVINKAAQLNEFVISTNITEDAVWESGNIYILASRIAVTDGATLTIQKGVVVKGEAGSGSNAT